MGAPGRGAASAVSPGPRRGPREGVPGQAARAQDVALHALCHHGVAPLLRGREGAGFIRLLAGPGKPGTATIRRGPDGAPEEYIHFTRTAGGSTIAPEEHYDPDTAAQWLWSSAVAIPYRGEYKDRFVASRIEKTASRRHTFLWCVIPRSTHAEISMPMESVEEGEEEGLRQASQARAFAVP